MEEKNSIFVLAIVGMVAIVGIIMAITSGNKVVSVNEDTVGQASLGIRSAYDDEVINGYGDEVKNSKCGDGLINGAEQCDLFNLGGKTCKSYGYTSGKLLCNSKCQVDTTRCNNDRIPRITSIHSNQYSYKNYWLDTGTINYYFNAFATMKTDIAAEAYLTTTCYEGQKWKTAYAEAMTMKDPSSNEYSIHTTLGVQQLEQMFDGTSGECIVNGCVFYNNRTIANCDNTYKQYNVNANTYPNIEEVMILKNVVTNKYFIYIVANNYNGGICHISYGAQWYNANGQTGISYWSNYLWNCPTQVSHIMPLNISNTVERIYLFLYMRPQEYTMSTSGYGEFNFYGHSQPIVVQGKSFVPATKMSIQDSEKAKSVVSELVRQEVWKEVSGQAINEKLLEIKFQSLDVAVTE